VFASCLDNLIDHRVKSLSSVALSLCHFVIMGLVPPAHCITSYHAPSHPVIVLLPMHAAIITNYMDYYCVFYSSAIGHHGSPVYFACP
jgi:hypothetical protein